jgi:hypothetical protein
VKPGPKKQSAVSIYLSLTPRALSVPLAAGYIGATTWFVEQELLRSGAVPYRVIGNQRVIDRAALDGWLDKQPTRRGKLGAPDCRKPKEGQDSIKKAVGKESES